MLLELANYFHISVDYILGRSDSVPSNTISRTMLDGLSLPTRTASPIDSRTEPEQDIYALVCFLYSQLDKLEKKRVYYGVSMRDIQFVRLALEQMLLHMQAHRAKTIPVFHYRRSKAAQERRRLIQSIP